MGQSVQVRLEGGETEAVKPGRGVRQGCCMSPILFNIYGDRLVEEAFERIQEHTHYVKVEGKKIKTIKYADDHLAVMATTEEKLQQMTDIISKIREKCE